MAEEEKPEGEDGEGEGKKKLSGKKLVIFIVLPLVLLLVIGGAAAFFLMGGKKEEHVEAAAPPVSLKPIFLALPDILVNLNTQGRQAAYLKLKVTIEHRDPLADPKLKELMPRVTDAFQTYLRELRPEDLQGSLGLYRLKEELMIRVSAAVAPIKIDDVLFTELLIQ